MSDEEEEKTENLGANAAAVSNLDASMIKSQDIKWSYWIKLTTGFA
jgi:hypothetical protein